MTILAIKTRQKINDFSSKHIDMGFCCEDLVEGNPRGENRLQFDICNFYYLFFVPLSRNINILVALFAEKDKVGKKEREIQPDCIYVS